MYSDEKSSAMNSRTARWEHLKQNTHRQTRWINNAALALLDNARLRLTRRVPLKLHALLITEAA
jgi:hypothetical protein